MFKTNEGKADRLLRALVGIVAIVLFFVFQGSVLAWVLLAVGVIMLVTSAIGWCPIYAIFGMRTCKLES